jgi:hypothetical protein
MTVKKRRIVIVVTEGDDMDDDERKGAGRPNAWWAAQRQQEAEEKKDHPEHLTEDPAGSDTFGGGFRAVRPAPHGGAVAVEEAIGAEDLCWCGEPLGHDWPGKDRGRKHPKGEAVTMSRQMTGTVDRRDLRGYHAEIQEFIMQCINVDGLSFRIGRNSMLLYPPDNTSPVTVYARNTDRQVRQLRKWYVTHVYPHIKHDEPETEQEQQVSKEEIEALADAVNDKVEHPKKETHPEPEPEPEEEEEAEVVPVAPPEGGADEWVPYVRERSGPSPNIVTNGVLYKCLWCENTDHPFVTDVRRGIGGHNRMQHQDTTNIHGPEARAKAIETGRANRMKEQVQTAIDTLYAAIGVEAADRKKMEELEATVDRLTGQLREQNTLQEQLDLMTKRAEEAEAKLALVREATGL